MTLPDTALTRAGGILKRELPEEYRYRDVSVGGEPGDLELYLHGFGHLLDLIRATTEQAYADAFAEASDNGFAIQPWLLPYLAELVGAELLAPDPDRRRDELNNSVLWSKSKGTLRNVDHVGDVISGAETMVREGWRITLTCPRPGLPPFSAPKADADAMDPSRAPPPQGCPDLRAYDHAVTDPVGGNPLYRLRLPQRDADGLKAPDLETFWKPRAPGAAPCFQGSYADGSARCPDLRDPGIADRPGAHPGRSLIHVRPPDGFFSKGLREVDLPDPDALGIAPGAENVIVDPKFVLKVIEGIEDAPHDRVKLKLGADFTVPAGARVTFRDILFTGSVPTAADPRPARFRVGKGTQVRLERCAVADMVLPGSGEGDDPDIAALIATDTIFGAITGPNRFARLVHCTVMGETDVERLHASDCLLSTLSSNLKCKDAFSCIRFSRFTPLAGVEGCFSREAPTNTGRKPKFVQRYLPGDNETCVLRTPDYGEPGYGVLDLSSAPAITEGAEDDGEMGAYHHAYQAAQIRALSKKLGGYLPLGQEIALTYDPLLAVKPPRLGPGGGV